MQTQTDTGATQEQRRRRRKAQPQTPLDLYADIVQKTHKFQTKTEQIAAFVETVQGAFPPDEAWELWARLKYHDVNPRRPDSRKPEEKEAEKKAAEQKAEDAKRKFSLALASNFLNSKLVSTGMLTRKATGPQLRAEGGKYIKVAKKIPKGKVLDDIASTDEQRLAIAAVLEG